MTTNANERLNMQRIQNVLLIWLDAKSNDNNTDCRDTIKQLKRVVNNVNTFTDGEQCVNFIQTISNNKVCMVVSGSLGQDIVPRVHDMFQVDTILVFCNNQEWHKQWAKKWPKIKGVFTNMTLMCEALKQAAQQCEQNAISISFVASNKNLKQLDPTFMYTHILKEILLTINFDDKYINEFITYCREVFSDDENELKNVNQLQTTYKNHIPIWWYTWDAFLYRMLNRALSSMDIDMIVRMGFFINDLNCDIQRLHLEQFGAHQSDKTFIVYRGQGLSKEDFTKMTKTEGGLLSFNNFLSTSKNRDVSLNFAQQTTTNPDIVGILFVISINPTYSTTSFASVSDVSYFHTKDEVLFSMHTIFRIRDIKPLDENNHLYEVNLTLINDNDQDYRTLTDRIKQESFPDSKGQYRLGLLLTKMGQFNKAQEVYEVLLYQTTNDNDKGPIYHQLGSIKRNQGEYQEALTYYEKSLDIDQKILHSNHPDLASSYVGIGIVYDSMGNYQRALFYYEKALEIQQQTLPPNHPDLASSYGSIGLVHCNMGDYPKALSSHEKALAIQQQSLPFNHSDLGTSYINIGSVYYNMSDYQKALSYYKTALAIQQESLPSNHPAFALSYMGLGLVYKNMGDYSEALSYYEKALEIQQQTLPSNHPDVGASYTNIGSVYYNMGDYQKALSFYENALAIKQESLPSNHPDLASSYVGIGIMYNSMVDYPKALSYYEKALEIQQQTLPPNHPNLASTYDNMGVVYENMEMYSKAHSFYELAARIGEESLPSNHPKLQKWRENLERLKTKL
ncbi:unnamed protein product [Adineta steineri]|uniref:Uncharacterized protein n=1 Tax=Adineta steineri TaxID=433720 RepID=A0A813M4C4_9BILA|nr:unnamed protein product [Adineta steineri]CAF4026690.1 unnamed protein product [Adineta steineri]